MSPRICLSLAGRDGLEHLASVAAAEMPDLVELRLDLIDATMAPSTVAELVAMCPLPAIVTCRPAWEGGDYRGSEADRRALLEAALAADAELVDIELDAPFASDTVRANPGRVLLSHHWAVRGCPGLDAAVARLLEIRPAVAKLVGPAERADDALALLAAARELQGAGVASACFCLGVAGAPSRLLSGAAGGGLVYAGAAGLPATAEGQWDCGLLKNELRAGAWGASPALFGVIGDPVDRSLSPVVFNAAFEQHGRAAAYLPLPSREMAPVLALAEASGVRGLSVTMPFKEEVAAVCSSLSPEAERVGAVNTLTWGDGGWLGDNTDGAALVDALETDAAVAGRRCAVIGAGGAGRAAAVALRSRGAGVVLLNRTEARAARVGAEIGVESGGLEILQDSDFDVIVNATPAGMNGTADTPVPTVCLKGHELVLDMVYRPLQTTFLRAAAARGCRTVNGLEMFLRQAARQHEAWFGEEAPLNTMRAAANRKLELVDRSG